MSRREFSKPVRREALHRADGRCEGILSETGERCPCFLSLAKYHFDHVIPDAMGGRPELANCQVLCVVCHDEKTKRDVALIAQAKRRQDRHNGIRETARIQSRGFPCAPKRHRATAPIDKWFGAMLRRPQPDGGR